MLISTSSVFAQKTITIKGKVKFPYNRFNMEIIERQGFDKTIVDSCKVKDDGTYEFKMKVDKPGVYTLDCQKWQSVQFWAEDEDLEINFRGEDTAKIKIKNPPYVHIKGGPNNELMNLMNWDGYRGYQLMIGISQGVYRIPGIDDQTKQEVLIMAKDERNIYTIQNDASKGEIKIADEVVAIIAALAATEVEGVASMAGNITNELIGKLGMKNLSKGVKVDVLEGIVTVSLALNLKYNYSIVEVSARVQEKVKNAIENMTGLEVSIVNVRIASVDMGNNK